ncbi:MAG: DUF6807 domain-containing protein [Planctomycetota bacterium]
MMSPSRLQRLLTASLLAFMISPLQAEEPSLTFHKADDRIVILNGKHAVSEYVFADAAVPRPYLINIKTLDGIQVTRNHPVHPGDDQDHPHHTGIFFTFGDLNGIDFWHLKGRVVHERFDVEPRTSKGTVGFAIENRYESLDGNTVFATERAVLTARRTDDGILYNFHNLITPKNDTLRVGSKEEGGLAVRVATPIALTSNVGGRMTDADGRSGGKAIWGQQTDWVDYSGTINGRHVGVLIVPHKRNFARCWWHARDYGLLAGNPFGPLNQKRQRHLIHRGHTLVLRYDVLIHSSATKQEFNLSAAAARVIDAQK